MDRALTQSRNNSTALLEQTPVPFALKDPDVIWYAIRQAAPEGPDAPSNAIRQAVSQDSGTRNLPLEKPGRYQVRNSTGSPGGPGRTFKRNSTGSLSSFRPESFTAKPGRYLARNSTGSPEGPGRAFKRNSTGSSAVSDSVRTKCLSVTYTLVKDGRSNSAQLTHRLDLH